MIQDHIGWFSSLQVAYDFEYGLLSLELSSELKESYCSLNLEATTVNIQFNGG